MTFRLAIRNIQKGIWKTIVTILAIALSVSIMFSILSYKQTIYNFLYAQAAADCGNSDITITTGSDSVSKFFNYNKAVLEEKGTATGVLSLYAEVGDTYVKLRGFKIGTLENLHDINFVSRRTAEISGMRDTEIIISKALADQKGYIVNQAVDIAVFGTTKTFYIYGIAEDSGYFVGTMPSVLTYFDGDSTMAKLVAGGIGYNIYNEIYITLNDKTDFDYVVETLKSSDTYKKCDIDRSILTSGVETETESLSAPLVISGVFVILMAILVIILLFTLSYSKRMAYISRLTMAGATDKQISGIFFVENIIIAILGSLIGGALANVVFNLLLKGTLGANAMGSLSVVNLIIAVAIGFVIAIVSGMLPTILAKRKTQVETLREQNRSKNFGWIIAFSSLGLALITFICEFVTTGMVSGYLSIFSLVFLITAVIFGTPYIIKVVAKLLAKVKGRAPVLSTTASLMVNQKSVKISSQILAVAMLVSMMVFTAWSLCMNLFGAYNNEFASIISVSNVASNIDVTEFTKDGKYDINYAVPAIWRTANFVSNDTKIEITIMGSERALEMINFAFIDGEAFILDKLSKKSPNGYNYIVLDYSYNQLYDIQKEDVVTIDIGHASAQFAVAGFVHHIVYTGNYIVTTTDVLNKSLGLGVNAVLISANGNAHETALKIRHDFTSQNYFVATLAEVYEWNMNTLLDLFDLIEFISIMVIIMAFLSLAANSFIGWRNRSREQAALRMTGFSKNNLLWLALYEHAILAIVTFVVAFVLSFAMVASFTHTILLFGIYQPVGFDFGVPLIAAAALAISFIVLPLAKLFGVNYNKNIKTRE